MGLTGGMASTLLTEVFMDLSSLIKIPGYFIFYYILEKSPPYGWLFPSSSGGLQPLTAAVGPCGPSFVFFWHNKFLEKRKLCRRICGNIVFDVKEIF